MRRSVLALVLASTLTALPSGLFHPLWSLLSTLWSASPTKAGPGWDPDGRGLTTPQPQPSTDAGAGWDPNGSR